MARKLIQNHRFRGYPSTIQEPLICARRWSHRKNVASKTRYHGIRPIRAKYLGSSFASNDEKTKFSLGRSSHHPMVPLVEL